MNDIDAFLILVTSALVIGYFSILRSDGIEKRPFVLFAFVLSLFFLVLLVISAMYCFIISCRVR
jgi:uncharacterized membrane protein YozB (DUF420 family)